jgi:hypothetical protein
MAMPMGTARPPSTVDSVILSEEGWLGFILSGFFVMQTDPKLIKSGSKYNQTDPKLIKARPTPSNLTKHSKPQSQTTSEASPSRVGSSRRKKDESVNGRASDARRRLATTTAVTKLFWIRDISALKELLPHQQSYRHAAGQYEAVAPHRQRQQREACSSCGLSLQTTRSPASAPVK